MTVDPLFSSKHCSQGRRRVPALYGPRDERERILTAARRLVIEQGVENLDLRDLRDRAGVDVRAFDAAFADRGELLLALFDGWVAQVGQAMTLAQRAQSSWVDGVRAALFELLCFFDGAPTVARFLVLGSFSGDSRLTARRRAVLDGLACALDAGSPRGDGRLLRAPFGADAVVGTVVAVIHGRLLEEPVPCLSDLAGTLMGVILTSYLSPEAARLELTRSLGLAAPLRRAAHG